MIERHDIYAHHSERDEWAQLRYREPLSTDVGTPVGDVCANEDYYHEF